MTDSSNGSSNGATNPPASSSGNAPSSSSGERQAASKSGTPQSGTPASRFRAHLAATDQQRAESLGAQVSRAEALMTALPEQLAAVRTTSASAAATVETAARTFTTTAAKSADAQQVYTALAALLDEVKKEGARLARIEGSWARQLRYRMWLIAAALGSVPWLVHGVLLHTKSGPAAEALMTSEQQRLLNNGRVLDQALADPQTPAGQRCAIEAAMSFRHQGPTPCPATGRGSSGR